MSNSATVVDQSFFLCIDDAQDAHEAIVTWAKEHELIYGPNRQPQGNTIDGAEEVTALRDSKNIIEALEILGWSPIPDDQFNITALDQNRHDVVGADHLAAINSLAPYIEPDSYICFIGEKNHVFRWKFTPEGVLVQEGKLVFKD